MSNFTIPQPLQGQITQFLSVAKTSGSPVDGLLTLFRTSNNQSYKEQALNFLFAITKEPPNVEKMSPSLMNELFSFFSPKTTNYHPQLVLISSATFLSVAENQNAKSNLIQTLRNNTWLSAVFPPQKK